MKIYDRSSRSVLLRSSLSVLAVLLLTERAGPTQHGQYALESEFAFSIPDRGVWSTATSGTADALRSGYGRIAPESGSPAPAGIAVFGFRQDGVLLSEASVPASAPVSSGRLFAEMVGPDQHGRGVRQPERAAGRYRVLLHRHPRRTGAGGEFRAGRRRTRCRDVEQRALQHLRRAPRGLAVQGDVDVHRVGSRRRHRASGVDQQSRRAADHHAAGGPPAADSQRDLRGRRPGPPVPAFRRRSGLVRPRSSW